jgi:hypothetical protein
MVIGYHLLTFQKRLFNEFDKEGYTNFEMKINFGTTNKPKLSTLGETIYRKFTAELFSRFWLKTKILNTNYITETKNK